MEKMAINTLKSYRNKKVFITGHTGFKGSWLTKCLELFGAEIKGYSLTPYSQPNHFSLLNLSSENDFNDLRDSNKLLKSIREFEPDIVFHLAAQPLVRQSYKDPLETYSTNVMGTANLLESVKQTDSVKAVVNVTTDKCYHNHEWSWGYRENDRLGGYDPYSASKACSELVTDSYRNSFFNLNEYNKSHQCLIASARAGNVIGGGDWAEDRLIPDLIRSINSKNSLIIRNPSSTRPWQHVLDPIMGYLMLGRQLLDGNVNCAEAWNFGPHIDSSKPVKDVIENINSYIPEINYSLGSSDKELHEANLLHLDSSKAMIKLNWKPNWNFKKSIEATSTWYDKYLNNETINTEDDINEYLGEM